VHKALETRYAQQSDVVFLYVQTVFEGASSNTYFAGLGDLDRHAVRGSYGFDPGGDKRPATMRMFHTRGTPWTIVLSPIGKVLSSGYTRSAEPLIAAIDQARGG
jgi:hypothetical protein